jgi:putative redox protein
MTVEITGSYLGDLKTELIHEGSKTALRTAAPLDNQGDGSSFSPTDLLAASLGSCVVTILGIVAKRHQIPLEGLRFRTEKHMSTQGSRRIQKVLLEIFMPQGLNAEQRKLLEQSAETCPVSKSLHPDLQKVFQFRYPD